MSMIKLSPLYLYLCLGLLLVAQAGATSSWSLLGDFVSVNSAWSYGIYDASSSTFSPFSNSCPSVSWSAVCQNRPCSVLSNQGDCNGFPTASGSILYYNDLSPSFYHCGVPESQVALECDYGPVAVQWTETEGGGLYDIDVRIGGVQTPDLSSCTGNQKASMFTLLVAGTHVTMAQSGLVSYYTKQAVSLAAQDKIILYAPNCYGSGNTATTFTVAQTVLTTPPATTAPTTVAVVDSWDLYSDFSGSDAGSVAWSYGTYNEFGQTFSPFSVTCPSVTWSTVCHNDACTALSNTANGCSDFPQDSGSILYFINSPSNVYHCGVPGTSVALECDYGPVAVQWTENQGGGLYDVYVQVGGSNAADAFGCDGNKKYSSFKLLINGALQTMSTTHGPHTATYVAYALNLTAASTIVLYANDCLGSGMTATKWTMAKTVPTTVTPTTPVPTTAPATTPEPTTVAPSTAVGETPAPPTSAAPTPKACSAPAALQPVSSWDLFADFPNSNGAWSYGEVDLGVFTPFQVSCVVTNEHECGAGGACTILSNTYGDCSSYPQDSGFIVTHPFASKCGVSATQISLEVDWGSVAVVWTAPYSSAFDVFISIGGTTIPDDVDECEGNRQIQSFTLTVNGENVQWTESVSHSTLNLNTFVVQNMWLTTGQTIMIHSQLNYGGGNSATIFTVAAHPYALFNNAANPHGSSDSTDQGFICNSFSTGGVSAVVTSIALLLSSPLGTVNATSTVSLFSDNNLSPNFCGGPIGFVSASSLCSTPVLTNIDFSPSSTSSSLQLSANSRYWICLFGAGAGAGAGAGDVVWWRSSTGTATTGAGVSAEYNLIVNDAADVVVTDSLKSNAQLPPFVMSIMANATELLTN